MQVWKQQHNKQSTRSECSVAGGTIHPRTMNTMIALMLTFLMCVSVFAVDKPPIPTFACNDYNNDCVNCVQAAPNLAFQCVYCPTDGVCHTVGSLFNTCDSSECISLSKASSCEKNYIDACDDVKKYGQPGFGYDRRPLFNETAEEEKQKVKTRLGEVVICKRFVMICTQIC